MLTEEPQIRQEIWKIVMNCTGDNTGLRRSLSQAELI